MINTTPDATASPILDAFTPEEQRAVWRVLNEATEAGLVFCLDDDYRLRPTKETAHLVSERYAETRGLRERIGVYKQVIADILMHTPAAWILAGVKPPDTCPYCGEQLDVPFDVHPTTDTNQRAMF